jgi:hypothetical protein
MHFLSTYTHTHTLPIPHLNMTAEATARMDRGEEDCHNRAVRTSREGRTASQDSTARRGQKEEDIYDRPDLTGEPEQSQQRRTGRKGS